MVVATAAWPIAFITANRFFVALRGAYLDEVTALLKPVLCDADGKWTADYTRLRFAAIKP
jgi:hypothetical protein